MDDSTSPKKPGQLTPATVAAVSSLVSVQPGAIVSRVLCRAGKASVTAFAFDAGQSLSEHTAPFDALVHVTSGSARITIAGDERRVGAGEVVLMPANVPHAVAAPEPFTMVLTMLPTEARGAQSS